jgi:hypothetical protein
MIDDMCSKLTKHARMLFSRLILAQMYTTNDMNYDVPTIRPQGRNHHNFIKQHHALTETTSSSLCHIIFIIIIIIPAPAAGPYYFRGAIAVARSKSQLQSLVASRASTSMELLLTRTQSWYADY